MVLGQALVDVMAAGLRRLGSWLARAGLFRAFSAAQATLWRDAARAAGLGGVEDTAGGLTGWAGPLRVRLTGFADRESRGTRITVACPGPPAGLTVRPEGLLTAVRGVRGIREVEIGHDTFDAAAWVEGPPAVARAVLDAGNRKALRALFDGRLERRGHSPFWVSGQLEDGVLRIDVPEVVPAARSRDRTGEGRAPGDEPGASVYLRGLDHLGEVLAEAIALARRLAPPGDVARRIAENLSDEPVTRVRSLALATLVREFPDHPATREALVAAREDPDAEVRLRAGIALGPEGRDVLLAIAGGEGAPDETTARAVAELTGHLTSAQARPLLHNALRTRRVATARACMEALGQRGGPEAIADLARVLTIEAGELAWAAARALATTRDPAAEAPLLRALAGGGRDLRLVAAMALGRVGTSAAVAPLREAETSDPEMRRAARQAIAEIQSRARGAAPGQLSLAGGESGQLSLASDEPGRLSLAESPRAASSVSGDERSTAHPGRRIPRDPSGRSPSE
jgi:HEAT repeat protein